MISKTDTKKKNTKTKIVPLQIPTQKELDAMDKTNNGQGSFTRVLTYEESLER